eukprot:1490890-Rhodomonas_salina.1
MLQQILLSEQQLAAMRKQLSNLSRQHEVLKEQFEHRFPGKCQRTSEHGAASAATEQQQGLPGLISAWRTWQDGISNTLGSFFLQEGLQ